MAGDLAPVPVMDTVSTSERRVRRVLIGVLILLFAALQYALWLGDHGLARLWQMEKSMDKQHAQNERLSQRNQRLQAEVIDLKKGKEALEERARSELGLIKPGETFYQVIETEPTTR